jgi:hypothetical protein
MTIIMIQTTIACADVLEQHLKEKIRSSMDQNVLETHNAVRVQLKIYCMGMKQLMSLKKYKDASANDVEQHMETAINDGSI